MMWGKKYKILTFIGEEPERELVVKGNQMLSVANNLMETQQPLPQLNDSNQLEHIQLIARARAVGIQYEFAHPGVQESEDDRRKRKRRNQRRVSDGERRLCAVIGDLHVPPPPLAGSSQLEDEAYCAIRVFEVDQMTQI